MRFKKIFSAEMERCYSVACMEIEGTPHGFFATEGRNGGCIAVDLTEFGAAEEILSGPGGTMGMVPIPGKEEEYLSGVRFYSLADWEEAGTAWAKREEDGKYHLYPFYDTPYLHRFDLLESGTGTWFIGCVLAAHKKTKEDFSQPGYVLAGRLPEEAGQHPKTEILLEGLYRNHGYERVEWEGRNAAMISCDNGVYVLTPPQTGEEGWYVERIMEQPVSDIAILDIDGDGEEEIAAIEPFHGSYFRIYKKIGGTYRQVFEHPEVSEFYHVAASGRVFGKPVFIGGCRRGEKQLFLISWDEKEKTFQCHLVESGVGPSNAMVVHVGEKELLISANREKAEAAIYEISED